MDQQNPFKWRHFEAEIIVLCVRWSVRYSLSYRDLEEMMRERGLHVDHSTIYRWVQHPPRIAQRDCYRAKSDLRSKSCSEPDAQPARTGRISKSERKRGRREQEVRNSQGNRTGGSTRRSQLVREEGDHRR